MRQNNRITNNRQRKSIRRDKLDRYTTAQRRAVKRLMKELRIIKEEPIKGVAALPASDKNLFLWHANIKGPEGTVWEKGIFHIEMEFPEDYPDNPPSLKLCTKIEHPNVFGGYICLDMLEQDQKTHVKQTNRQDKEMYGGWSTSYTVQSILIQLQAFLFEAEVSKVLSKTVNDPKRYEQKKREWHSAVEFSVQQSLLYRDKNVSHYPPRSPWPPLPTDEEIEKSKEKTMTELERIEAELVCFYTRQTYKEDCLGYGISFTKNLRTGSISSIHSDMDYVSLRAYMNHKLRYTANNEPFTHFLPLFITKEHGQKGIHLADRALSIIMTGNHGHFKPQYAIEVFPKIMNSFIISLMMGKKVLSLKAIRAYANVHRLLIEYVRRFPELLKEIDEKVKSFITTDEGRHKEVIPNMGEFMALMSVTKYKWEDIKDVVIQEAFARNVFWILNNYPELEGQDADYITDEDRLTYSFTISQTSLRNLLFHIFFMQKVVKTDSNNLAIRAEAYDTLYGRCAPVVEDSFVNACTKILNIETYEEAFKIMEEPKTNDEIVDLLQQSIQRSKEKGYHGTQASVLSPEEFAKQNQAFDFEEMCQEVNGELKVIDDEEKWKKAAQSRWGFTKIPNYLENEKTPWRKLYLQYNLQDFIAKFNDNPDFKRFHKTLDISQEIPRLEIMMFNPSNIKSRYFYLTCILTKLKLLNTLVIRKGTEGLGVKGFKALIKGLSNNPGNLTRLNLEYCGINATSIKELTKGTKIGSNLKALNLHGNPIGEEGAINLANFLRFHQNLPNLEELDLSDCQIGGRGANQLALALLVKYKLKKLNLLKNNINKGLGLILNNLSYNPNIKNIDVSRIPSPVNWGGTSRQSSDSHFSNLLELTPSLESINFWKTNLSSLNQKVFDTLGTNETIQKLDFGESNFGRCMPLLGRTLGQNSTIKDLNLENNQLTLSDLEAFLQSLQESWKINHKNDDVSLEIENFHLQNSSMSGGTRVNEKLHNMLGKMVHMCKKLTYLNLNHSKIDHTVARHLHDALMPNSGIPLQTLLLRRNNLGKLGIKYLTTALSQNKTIKVLDISGNSLGVIGAQFISEIIVANETLEELNLFGNFLEIEGISHVAKALVSNKHLKKIDLGLNRAKVRGAATLLEVFKTNGTLEHVALKHNHIKDKLALELVNTICSSPTSKISYVAFAGNPISKDARREIAVAFKKLSTNRSQPIKFDLSQLVEVKEPERLERTIYITPLRGDITELKIKKLFYDHQCGVILHVNIFSHKDKTNFNQSKYAFVEFAHPDSVKLARNLAHKRINLIDGTPVRISRAGI